MLLLAALAYGFCCFAAVCFAFGSEGSLVGWRTLNGVQSAGSEIESSFSWASSIEWTYQQSSKLRTPIDSLRCAQTTTKLAVARPDLGVMICVSP